MINEKRAPQSLQSGAVDDRRRQLESWCTERLGNLLGFEALCVEASTRRFYRARGIDGSYVAMDAPPATENNAQFRALSALFRANDVPVPEVIAFDERGFILVTDFGDRLFGGVYAAGREDEALDLALRSLVRIQAIASDVVGPYEISRFVDELATFTDWLVIKHLGLEPPEFIEQTWRVLVEATQAQPMVTVHRDYHSRNLLLRDDGSIGIVDFQDALIGPVTYDLVSLLRDCYHKFPETTVAKWQARYLAATDCGLHGDEFRRAFDLTGIQRHLKATGIFARLKLRDGRASHLADIVPTLDRIVTVGSDHDELRALAGWIEADVIPAAKRAVAAI